MKCDFLVYLSSEWKLCLDSGDPYLNLPRNLNLLVDEIDFVVDPSFLGNFSERSSRAWFKSVF